MAASADKIAFLDLRLHLSKRTRLEEDSGNFKNLFPAAVIKIHRVRMKTTLAVSAGLQFLLKDERTNDCVVCLTPTTCLFDVVRLVFCVMPFRVAALAAATSSLSTPNTSTAFREIRQRLKFATG